MNQLAKTLAMSVITVASFAALPANADTVLNTSLQNINASSSSGTASAATTTSATGTRTTVTGAGANAPANRVSGSPVLNNWYQNNVGIGATVGITTDYAQSGNGSAYFSSTAGDTGKADLQYYFGAGGVLSPVALSTLSSFSFDYYRDSSSTVNANLSPVLRLDILENGVASGALIFESVYNTNAAAAVDGWTTFSGNLSSGIFWTNNAGLGPTDATAGGTKTLAQWITDNGANSTLSVYGLEIGIGSGWAGQFYGAVDNVKVAFTGGPSVNSNFEVAQAAVPEPAMWAMMLLGFGAIGVAMRRRKPATAVSFG